MGILFFLCLFSDNQSVMVDRMTIAGDCFWEKDFCIPSRTEAGHAILDGILLQLQDFEWPQKDIFAIQLAFEEALVNAIRHGNQSENRRGVKVHLEISSQVFLARISDEGPGFDPDHLPDPTLDDFLERPCGRGVKLMRTFMTSVDFNERGNVVTMKKERSCPVTEIREEQRPQTEASANPSDLARPVAQSESAVEFSTDDSAGSEADCETNSEIVSATVSESDLSQGISACPEGADSVASSEDSFSAEADSVATPEEASSVETGRTAEGDNAFSVSPLSEDNFPSETDEKSN